MHRLTRLLPAAATLAVLLASATDASAQYFGRNKVQYRAFDFQIIRTEHFDVYYYDQEREAALDAARMVERSYGRISRLLQHEFRERKPLIVYASHTDFQQTNAIYGELDEATGGVTESAKNRMILPFTGSYADFDHVMTHELVHGFQYDVIFRRGPIEEANPFMARLPLWFMEGMAEYLSIGRIDALTHAWLRDAVLNGYMRDIAEMSQRDDYLSYRFGQSLWAYIGQKWGDEVVGILLQKAPRIGVERAFASTLGISLAELSAEWLAEVRKTYLPQITDKQRPQDLAVALAHHRRMEDPWYVAPAISPDGRHMVYLSQRDGVSFDMWLADAQSGKRIRRLVESAKSADFESLRYMYSGTSFSHDGRYVAFVAKSGGEDVLNIYDLERKKVIRKLQFGLNGITSPSWAPDGQRIVFSGLDGGISDLFVTDLEGNLTRLTNDKYADLLPSWSPDGTRIALTTDRAPGTDFSVLSYGELRVAIYDLALRRFIDLPHQDEGKNVNPVWSPDSRKLIWVNDRNTVNNLYLFDLDRQELSRITDLTSGVIAISPISPVLSWAAQSGKLLFGYFESAGYSIYGIDDPLSLPRVRIGGPEVLAQATSVTPTTAPAEPTAPAAIPAAADTLAVRPVLAGDSAQVAQPLAAAGQQAAGDSARAADPLAGLVRSFYRTAEAEFRPSRDTPPNLETQAPVSVLTLLDSSAFALPDTAGFDHADYKVKFSADMVGRPTIGVSTGDYYGNGMYGGSYVVLSDMLGNHNIMLAGNINGSFSDASVYTGYSFARTRLNYNVAFQQVPLYRYYGGGYFDLDVKGQTHRVGADVYLRDVVRALQAGISYPFSTFMRAELNGMGVFYKSDVLYRGWDIYTGEYIQKDESLGNLSYWVPEAALVFDNTYFGWTGPVMGRRYRAQVSRTIGDVNFTEALLDFRNYWNIKRNLVVATRAVGLTRFGQEADRFGIYWGGPYYLRGYDYGSYDNQTRECVNARYYGSEESLSACPIRDQLVGSSAVLLNAEVRYPIVKELQIGFLGNFPPIDAVAFFDGAVAWDQSICTALDQVRMNTCAPGATKNVRVVWDRKPGQDPFLYREPLFSWGLGLRMNVFYTVLRLDYAFPLNRPDRGGVFSVSFGPSF